MPAGIEKDFTGVDVSRDIFDRAIQQARKTLLLDTFPRFEDSDVGRQLKKELGAETAAPSQPADEPSPAAAAGSLASPADVPLSLSTPRGSQPKRRGSSSSSSAKVAPMVHEEPAVNLAASITAHGVRTPDQLMHPSRYRSRYAPDLQRFAPSDSLCSWWGLRCITTAPPPLSSLDYRLAVHRSARTVWATHVAAWLILLASLGDAALLTFATGLRVSQLLDFTLSDWRLALLPQTILVGSSLLSLLLTTRCMCLRTSTLMSNPAYLEILCSALFAAPPLVASYFLVAFEHNPPTLPLGDSYVHARALAYLATYAAAALSALQQAALAVATAGMLLGSAIAVAFTMWYARGGATSAEDSGAWPPDTWAAPFFHSLCLLACFCVGGRLAYVREQWLAHEALLRDEMARGAQHATRLLAELHTPFPRVSAFQDERGLKHLETAAAPLSAREADRARADAANRAALHPQLGMAGGKSVVDSADRESEGAVVEEAARAASMAIFTAGPEVADKVEHVGIVCCRVHGCDSGSTRAGSIAEACEAMLALCEATAAKASGGWVCVESRGPMMILACGLYPPSPQAASPPTPTDGEPPAGGEAASPVDESADAEAAALSCALGIQIVQAAAAARSSADAADAWANLGTSSLLPTSGHIEAQVSVGVGVGTCLGGMLRFSSGAPRHVLLGEAVEAARTSAMHRQPGLVYTDGRTHRLVSGEAARASLLLHLGSSGGDVGGGDVGGGDVGGGALYAPPAASVEWKQTASPLPEAMEEGEQPIWATGHDFLPSALSSTLSDALADASQPVADPMEVISAAAERRKQAFRDGKYETGISVDGAGTLSMAASASAARGGSGDGAQTRWAPARPMPAALQQKFAELTQNGHLRGAAELVARWEASEAAAEAEEVLQKGREAEGLAAAPAPAQRLASPPPSPPEGAGGEVSITVPPDLSLTDEAAASTPDQGVSRDNDEDEESPEDEKARELAQLARRQRSAGSALRDAVLTSGRLDGRFAHAPWERTYMAWKGEEERRAASKSGKGLLCVLLLWGAYEALLIATLPVGANIVWFPGIYALLAFCAFALALAFATLADVDRAWRRLTASSLARPLCVAFYVGVVALVAEALLQRNSGDFLRATPLFALLVPLGAYGNALPPTWAWPTTLACYALLQSAMWVLAYSHTVASMRNGYPALLLAESALFIAVISVLACWQCRVATEQQRLSFVLAQSACRQEGRASTILRTALPAQLVWPTRPAGQPGPSWLL